MIMVECIRFFIKKNRLKALDLCETNLNYSKLQNKMAKIKRIFF